MVNYSAGVTKRLSEMYARRHKIILKRIDIHKKIDELNAKYLETDRALQRTDAEIIRLRNTKVR